MHGEFSLQRRKHSEGSTSAWTETNFVSQCREYTSHTSFSFNIRSQIHQSGTQSMPSDTHIKCQRTYSEDPGSQLEQMSMKWHPLPYLQELPHLLQNESKLYLGEQSTRPGSKVEEAGAQALTPNCTFSLMSLPLNFGLPSCRTGIMRPASWHSSDC